MTNGMKFSIFSGTSAGMGAASAHAITEGHAVFAGIWAAIAIMSGLWSVVYAIKDNQS